MTASEDEDTTASFVITGCGGHGKSSMLGALARSPGGGRRRAAAQRVRRAVHRRAPERRHVAKAAVRAHLPAGDRDAQKEQTASTWPRCTSCCTGSSAAGRHRRRVAPRCRRRPDRRPALRRRLRTRALRRPRLVRGEDPPADAGDESRWPRRSSSRSGAGVDRPGRVAEGVHQKGAGDRAERGHDRVARSPRQRWSN